LANFIRKALPLVLTVIIVFLFTSVDVFGQDKEPKVLPVYSLGDQTLSINGGLFVPLFFQALDGTISSTNLTPGGIGSLEWNAYINANVKVGLEAGGVFAFSPNFNVLLILPITVKATYIFSYYPFDFPIFLGTGLNIIKYQDLSHIDFLLKPGFSVFWRYNASWSFGLNFVYWWIFQAATGSQPSDETRMGNFLEISLSALYHF